MNKVLKLVTLVQTAYDISYISIALVTKNDDRHTLPSAYAKI